MHSQAAYETAAHAEPLPWIKASEVASSWQGAFWSWRTFCFLPTAVWHHHRDSSLTQASSVGRASWRGTNTPAALLQKPSWWLHSLNRAGWPCDSTWRCGNGRLAECRAQTVHTLTFIVEQWVQKLSLPPPTRLSVKRNPAVTLLLFDPYHDLGYLPEPSLLPLNREKWSYVSS